jgi:hypothetical protein
MNTRPEWLDRDIVSDTEKLVGGKHWSEFTPDESMTMLGMSFAHNQKKDAYLTSIDDTPFSMKWDEFKQLLTRRGFELVLTDTFNNPHGGNIEELCILGHREKGLLVVATSYAGNLNGGTCYGECTKTDEQGYNLPTGFSYAWNNNRTDWHIDVRDGMFSRIAALEQDGYQLVPKWQSNQHFLWLVDYAQTKGDYDRDEINGDRLSRCPGWIREMVGR